jgi:DnaJ like chaperone protein
MGKRLKFIFFILFAFAWCYFFQSACRVMALNIYGDQKTATVFARPSEHHSSISWWGKDGRKNMAQVQYAREKLSRKRLLGFTACEWNGRYYSPSFLKQAYPEGKVPLWYNPQNAENYCVGEHPPSIFGLATLAITLLPIPMLLFLRGFALETGLLPSREELEAADNPTLLVVRRIVSVLIDTVKGGRYDALYCMSVRMALSDGKLESNEAAALNTIVDRLTAGAPATDRLAALNVLQEARTSGISFIRYAERYVRRVAGNRADLELGLELLVTVAMSDHYLDSKQQQLLEDACRIFELRETLIAQTVSRLLQAEEELRRNQGSQKSRKNSQSDDSAKSATESENSTSWAYKELGCPEGVSLELVKKEYRSLVKQYHPDKLRSRGVSGQLLQQGEQRFLRIQRAYEVLAGG